MGAPKYKHLYGKKRKDESRPSSSSPQDKRDIQGLVEKIKGLLNNPEKAKKAAQILENMLKK